MSIAGVEAVAYSFIHRLQSHPQLYSHFIRVMSGYATKKLDSLAVVSKLDTLFQSHDDLLTGYHIFLPSGSGESLPHSRKNGVIAADMNKLNPCINFMNKVQKRFGDERDIIWEYLQTIRAFTKGKLSNNEAYDTIAIIFGDENQDLVDEFELFLGDTRGKKKINKKRKKREENNLSSTPLASPNNSSEKIKNRRQKTTHDDLNLYMQMEDEMFELDIQLSHMQTTVQSAKNLMKILRDSAEEHQIINIDKYFSALSLSYIRKEYKEQGFVTLKRLREDPKHVLPQILLELESKEEELVESRKKLNKHWQESHEQKQNSTTNSS